MGFWSRLLGRGKKRRKKALATYSAARRDRTTRDWSARSTSADGAIIPDLQTLNARARQLVRDDPHAKSVIRAFRRNVVGTGITPAAAVRDDAGRLNVQFNKTADALWYDWTRKPRCCDMERRRTFAAIQRWVASELVEVGEALVIESVVIDSVTSKGRLVLQLAEAEQLDRYKLKHTDEFGVEREIRGGVEVDEFGAAVAFWIYERHPNDSLSIARPTPITLESKRIPAHRVHHIMEPERARQTRGVTRLSPSMQKLRDLSEWDFANLQAARAEACIGVVITTESNGGPLGLRQPADEDGGADRTDADGNDEFAFQPIMVARVRADEKVEPFTPSRPGGQYEPFKRANLRSIAAGAGVSYEQAERDFTGGTYSSQRQGMLEDQREFEPLQELLINHLCQPVWESFIELAVMNGDLVAPGYARNRDRWNYAEWYPQSWPWIDPEKEAQADTIAIEKGFDTKEAACRRRGLDWREVAEQRVEEERYELDLRRRMGIPAAAEDLGGVAPTRSDAEGARPPGRSPQREAEQDTGPDALQSTEGLNGAQITAAVGILEKLGAGLLAPEAATSLLKAVGIDPAQVAEMVNATIRDRESIRQRMQETDAAPDPSTEPAEAVA